MQVLLLNYIFCWIFHCKFSIIVSQGEENFNSHRPDFLLVGLGYIFCFKEDETALCLTANGMGPELDKPPSPLKML